MPPRVKRLTITVELESPLRVGGPRDPVRGVDLPMASVAGVPVIPGPSLKGAVRAQLEEHLIALAHGGPDLLRPCIPTSKPSRAELALPGFRGGGACSAQAGEEETENGRPPTETICPACYLLGAQGLVGFVRVPFLRASVSQEELVGIAIDRGRGVVRAGGNWTYEFVPGPAIFTGSVETPRRRHIGVDGREVPAPPTFTGDVEILLEDPARGWALGKPRPGFEEQDRWLLTGGWTPERVERELVVERLEAIRVLGGFKSKGFGRVKVRVTPITNEQLTQ